MSFRAPADQIIEPARRSGFRAPREQVISPASMSQSDAFWSGAADGASFGFGDEGAGFVEGIGAVARGEDYRSAYQRRVREARDRLAQARREHPWSTTGGQAAGMVASTLVTGGVLGAAGRAAQAANMTRTARLLGGASRLATGTGGLPGQSALISWGGQRGLRAALAQGASAGYTGAAFGGLYGAGSSEEDTLEGRLGDAGQAAATTFLTSAPMPWLGTAIGARDPVLRAVTGGILGAAGGGTAAAVSGGDWRMGAAAGAAGGAGAASALRPTVMAPFTSNNALARTAGGALIGAPVGAAAGAMQNPDDPGEGARRGAVAGAVLGGVAGGSGMGRSIVSPRISPARTSSIIPGAPPPGGGGGGATAGSSPEARLLAREADDLMYEAGIDNVRGLRRRLAQARVSPLDYLWTDVFGNRAGTMRTRALAQGRGTTADVADTQASARARSLSTTLSRQLTRRLGVNSTPRRANETAEDAYERISNDIYNPILNGRRIEGEFRQRLDDIVENRMDPDLLRLATDRMSAVARMRGEAPPQPGDARYYHKLYSALGRTIRNLRANPAAVERRLFGPEELAAAENLRGFMARTMDDAIPRYNEARTQWANWADAENWIDEGRALVMGRAEGDGAGTIWRPEDVRSFMDNLTDFQREHVRIGVADELARRFTMRSRGTGNANAAEAFNVEGLQNILREVFPTEQSGNDYLRILNEANQLMRNAQTWGGGSSTAANVARAGRGFVGQFMSNLDNFSTLERTGAGLGRLLREDAALADDNAIGRFLLSSPRENIAMRREILRLLKQMEDERINRGRTAGAWGVGATALPEDTQ